MVQNGLKWFKLVSISSKWLNVVQNYLNWFKVAQNGSKWLKLVNIARNGSNKFQMVKYGTNIS